MKGGRMNRLDGKVALITGASRGYGRAITEQFARDGAFVVVHYATNEEAARQTVAGIQSAGGNAISLGAALDGSPAGIDALYSRLDEALAVERGTARVDILVNNAGICLRGTIEETDEALFD